MAIQSNSTDPVKVESSDVPQVNLKEQLEKLKQEENKDLSLERKPTTPKELHTKEEWDASDKKVESIDLQIKTFSGKENCNPHLWARDNKWDRIKSLVKERKSVGLSMLKDIPNIINPRIDPKKELPTMDNYPKQPI